MRGRPAGRWLRAAGVLLASLLILAAGGALWFRSRIAACLPRLDGAVELPGLGSTVTVSRDRLGVPTLSGTSRLDLARATGWIHAQDRFFQMDLLRRRGAGELSELFGPAALPLDREARAHSFRRLAQEVLARESPERQALLKAYALGVNAGLAALSAKPWEYVILRTSPRPWGPEDCVLITYAMTLDLQESTGQYVRGLSSVRDELGPASLAFFAPVATSADSPLDGSRPPSAPIPPPSELDLRRREGPASADTALAAPAKIRPEDGETAGSNSFAVAGNLALGGGALLANDMHLHLGVPNLWYRISLVWPGHRETGLTLPGAPTLVVGSTGQIAWGFTNSYAGTGDILLVSPSISPELYHGPHNGDLVAYQHRQETVPVHGSHSVMMDFLWTVWGPVVGDAGQGRQLVYHWTADDPVATNTNLLELEDAANVGQAVAIAHRTGIPVQNFVVADSSGQIAWTVAGFLPKRVGYDGRQPVNWLFGDRRWDGYLAPADVPAVLYPRTGILWTANNRTVGGKAFESLGDAGYAIPARARQIEDDLKALAAKEHPIQAKDLLGVQLDDRALMLESWHSLLQRILTPELISEKPSRGPLLAGAAKWDGKADVSSVGYRVVRAFRLAVAHRVFDPIFEPCTEKDPDFSWTRFNFEQPLETLLKERPLHLLDPAFSSWDALLVAAADDVSSAYARQRADPSSATWGDANTARIQHPFARNLPGWAASWMSMPADPLPGDSHMPRVLNSSFGASERFVVSPGHEEQGIFEMPGGESSNPLSPYFRAGHAAWLRGESAPFLPGPPEHTLELKP